MDLPEPTLIALAHARGLELDEARAATLRPQLESLLARLADLGARLPRETAPPPGGPAEPGA